MSTTTLILPEATTPPANDTRKTVLVTGAGVGGIGGALALEFHRANFRVFAAARRLSTLEPLTALGIESIELDVTSEASITAAVAKISSLTGNRLDMLINNAGSAVHVPALDLDIEGAVKNMFDVNVFGVMRMVKACGPMLIVSEGCIVNVGSIAPIVPLAFSSAYNATKAALHAYGDALKLEMEPLGVQVTTIITGGVKSNIVRDTKAELLPKDSLYQPIREFWEKRVFQSQENAMETETYAKGVVRALLKNPKPVWFWYGAFSKLAWFLYRFTWMGLRQGIMKKNFGFNKLKQLVIAARKKQAWEVAKRAMSGKK